MRFHQRVEQKPVSFDARPRPANVGGRARQRWVRRRHTRSDDGEWPNRLFPALGGKTPRQAVRTKKGRAAMDALLKEIEFLESQKPADQQFEIGSPRRGLWLESP